jgi:DNA topoisomerase-1
VADILYRSFSNIFDFGFTAKVESNLDLIAQGEIDWPDVVREIYDMYNPVLREILADKTAMRKIAAETG